MTITISANTRRACVTCHEYWATPGELRCDSCSQTNPRPKQQASSNPAPAPKQQASSNPAPAPKHDNTEAVLVASWQSSLAVNDPGLI
jgi:hypothetical protein